MSDQNDAWEKLRHVTVDQMVTQTKLSGSAMGFYGRTTPEGWPFMVVVAVASPGNDGGPAFPVPMPQWYVDKNGPVEGMSLRDYFAATTPMEHPTLHEAAELLGEPVADYTAAQQYGQIVRAVARLRYNLADAMLAARTKRPEELAPKPSDEREIPF